MILEERGLFWWQDEPIPDRQYAPNSSVAGLIKIEDDGRITLELDSYLPSEHGPISALTGDRKQLDKCIQGILKGTNRRILLLSVIRSGGRFSSSGISFERFMAVHCLVAEQRHADAAPKFDTLEVPLGGFEGWLRLGSIELSKSDTGISAKYTELKEAAYEFEDGELSINFNAETETSGIPGTNTFSLKESASIRLRSKSELSLDDLKSQYGLLEDLFILLTDSDYCLDWPWVSTGDDTKYRFYFLRVRSRNTIAAPEYYECCTSFPQLRDEFGSIWSNWKTKREEFGPGFYLYLGTRRGMRLYAEHRFVNLIWGIEAFHRKKYPTSTSNALSEKIDRIVEQITAVTDKRWLREKLKNAHEPPLGQRIFEVFQTLPIDLDQARLRAFSETCARLRNDISHFGIQRHAGSYTDSVQNLERLSGALSTLCHVLLLHEIGINKGIFKRWIYEGFRSYPIKVDFVEAGLLDKSCLSETSKQAAKNPADAQ
jgi:hypothetical protein